MAVDKIRGTQLYIKVETAPSSGVFAHPCLINTKRGIKFQSSTNKVIVPDCDNPDDPAWTEAIKDGLSATIDGAGMLDKAAVPDYDAWFRSPTAKNVQVWLGTSGYWAGAFQLTGWEVTGDRNQYAEASVTLESSGVLGTYTAA